MTPTPREHEVLTLVAEGLTNPQIARTLGITLGTVKQHAHDLHRKAGTRTRVGLCNAAWGRGWLAPPQTAMKEGESHQPTLRLDPPSERSRGVHLTLPTKGGDLMLPLLQRNEAEARP